MPDSTSTTKPIGPPRRTRVAIIGSPDKPAAADQISRVAAWVTQYADVVHTEITYDSSQLAAIGI
jgi:hypothetical protein